MLHAVRLQLCVGGCFVSFQAFSLPLFSFLFFSSVFGIEAVAVRRGRGHACKCVATAASVAVCRVSAVPSDGCGTGWTAHGSAVRRREPL